MIPLEQGSVFRRLYCLVTSGDLGLSQSLWNRAVSSDTTEVSCTALDKSQSLWNRAVSSDTTEVSCTALDKSQSLWNRAVSSDQEDLTVDQWAEKVSIPLEQGSVFRRYGSREFSRCSIVSIPLEQGSVFRLNHCIIHYFNFSVSIPLEQGSVFRQGWFVQRN